MSALGSFDLAFKLPPARPTSAGPRRAVRRAAATSGTHYFQIQEFRAPSSRSAASASTGVLVIGGGGDVTVDAKYFAGGGLAGARGQLVR
jgi:hypothetical protein